VNRTKKGATKQITKGTKQALIFFDDTTSVVVGVGRGPKQIWSNLLSFVVSPCIGSMLVPFATMMGLVFEVFTLGAKLPRFQLSIFVYRE
jgi:hypothetical protein